MDDKSGRTLLDTILGTQANVSILRVLTQASSPLGQSEASRRAGLTRQGGLNAIDRLFQAGVVEYVGTGSTKQVCLRREHPLASALTRLFETEAWLWEDLLQGIKDGSRSLRRSPKAVWLERRRSDDPYREPVVIVLVADSNIVDELAEELKGVLVEVEQTHDVTIEVKARTEADLAAMNEDLDLIRLLGPSPRALTSSPQDAGEKAARRHEDYDERSMMRARRLSELLVHEPGLRNRALAWVNERLEEKSDKDLAEWKRILESTSLPRLQRLLTSDSERAIRLRQSIPFYPILDDQERAQILDEPDDGH